MEHFLHPIILWLHVHPTWAGVVTFIITFIESLAIIGLIVPGSITLSAVGGLVGSGIVPATEIFAWAIAGAILGDGISYWVGYRYHATIRKVWPINRMPKLMAKGEQFFVKHGGKSIFIGRFVGAVRPVIPLIAGMLQVRPRKFLTISIISGILWAPAYMIPGIIVGAASAHYAPDRAIHFIVTLLILIAIIIFISWLFRRFASQLKKLWCQLIDRQWLRLPNNHPHLHKWIYEYEHPATSRPFGNLIITIVFTGLFLLIFSFIRLKLDWLGHFNHSVLTLFESLHTNWWMNAALWVSAYLGKSWVILATSLVLIVYLMSRRDWHAARIFAGLIFLTAAVIELFKKISGSLRPDVIVQVPNSFSFPSGHTVLALVFFGFIAFLIAHINPNSRLRRLAYSCVAVIVSLVGLSRLYLNVHWFSDIIAAVLLGAVILSATVLAYRRKERDNRYQSVPLLIIMLISLTVFGSVYHYRTIKQYQVDYQLRHELRLVDPAQWWYSSSSLLPEFRSDRLNHPIEHLNIQWFASLKHIKQQLTEHGWQPISRLTLRKLAQQIMSNQPLLSPFSRQFEHHRPVLIMVKPLKPAGDYLVIRLWDGGYQTPVEKIYLGNIRYHIINKHWLWWRELPCPDNVSNLRKIVFNSFARSEWRTIRYQDPDLIKMRGCEIPQHDIILVRSRSY